MQTALGKRKGVLISGVSLERFFTFPQDINSVYQSLLEREIKLHFLQILTPGAVYPDRVSRPNIWPPGGTSSPDQGGSVEGDVESSIHTTHSKRFKMNKGGLPWETVETVHWFMYPGQCPIARCLFRLVMTYSLLLFRISECNAVSVPAILLSLFSLRGSTAVQ